MPLGSRPDFGVHSKSLRALFSLNNMAVEKDWGGGRSGSQLLKGSFNFTFNRKIKSVNCISKSFSEKSGHSMVCGSFIMIGIMSLDTHVIKCCLVGPGKQARKLGFSKVSLDVAFLRQQTVGVLGREQPWSWSYGDLSVCVWGRGGRAAVAEAETSVWYKSTQPWQTRSCYLVLLCSSKSHWPPALHSGLQSATLDSAPRLSHLPGDLVQIT